MKNHASRLIILSILLSLASCMTFSPQVLEGAGYMYIPVEQPLNVLDLRIEDDNGIVSSNPFIVQLLDSDLRAAGFSIDSNSSITLEVFIYEKQIKSSLEGNKSLSGVLLVKKDGDLAARVLYSTEQPRGTDSDRELAKLVSKLVKEFSRVIRNQDQ
jgi:hypothetical protein